MAKPYVPEVVFRLVALVDGLTVFSEEYTDTAEVQETGLEKAEYAVEKNLDGMIEEETFYD